MKLLLVSAMLAYVFTPGAVHAYNCNQVRQYVSAYGASQARAMALAYGMTPAQERAARRCLRDRKSHR